MKPELLRKLENHKKYDQKWLPKFLKYLGKIPNIARYEEYKKQIKVSIIEWTIELHIRTLFLFIMLICLSAGIGFTPNIYVILFLSEGISFTWFLLIELKRDLWRK